VITLEELQEVVGKPFPGGTYTIEPYRHWLMSDAILDPPRSEGVANPMWVYYTALAGMGISVDDLFRLVGATADDGPMFGEATMELEKPLRVGATYEVSGAITDIQRKEGRKAGVFDIVAFRLELRDENGDVAAVSTNSFIFPRRG
jgi:MaoC dehydratase-like protein